MLLGMIDGYKGMYVILHIVRESETDVAVGELAKRMSVSAAPLETTDYKGHSQYISLPSDSFMQAPYNADFIRSQYDIMLWISVGLTMLAGILPANLAAKKDPVEALRNE